MPWPPEVLQLLDGLAGAMVGAGVSLGVAIPGFRAERRRNASGYLTMMGDALCAMAAQLKAGVIPHRDGHTFEELLKHFERTMCRYLEDDTYKHLATFKTLLQRAEETDSMYAAALEPDRVKLDALIADMEGVCGTMRGLATRLQSR
jgi:hypothetical protein